MRRPGERIELERNPHYHSAGDVAIERVTYLTLEDLNTELNLYRSGALDVTSEVPNTQVGWLQQNLPGELHIAPYLSTYGYAINLARVPERDARMALSMAVDRGQITGQVTGAGERPAYGWVPAGVPGYTPAQFTWAALPGGERIEQARRLWRAARGRHAAPDRLRLCTDASANHRRTAVALVDQWRRTLGVDVTIVEMEWKAYLALRENPGDCDLVRFGWSADFVDPEAFLALFTSGHAQNVAGYTRSSLRRADVAGGRCSRRGPARGLARQRGAGPVAGLPSSFRSFTASPSDWSNRASTASRRIRSVTCPPAICGCASPKKIGREACAIPPKGWTERSGVLSVDRATDWPP